MPIDATSAESANAQRFNLQATLARLGGDHKLLGLLIEIFVEDSPALLEQLKAAYQAGDNTQVQYAAHSLRGLASNFDATVPTAEALEIERLAIASQLADPRVVMILASLTLGVETLRRELPIANAKIAGSAAV
jgi:HPt (histidine-containing phosphotransfer) domain-containing protein